MTSERAQIRDARVRKLAEEIIEAQRREFAEMRYLIADISRGNTVDSVYREPPAKVGTVQDALSNTLISKLDPAPMPEAEAEAEANRVLGEGPRCRFSRSSETDPILWVARGQGAGAMNLNGVIVALNGTAAKKDTAASWKADGLTMAVRPLGEDADWRSNAELVFSLDDRVAVGYRGFWSC